MLDALIIGAGPAGCVAALILARGGKQVVLVEQHRFPRDKVCGECLSAVGYSTLARLGLLDSFRALSPIQLTRSHIHLSNGRSIDLPLPEPMWGISRLRLDEWLLNHARNAGARILQPARCERIDGDVVVRDLLTNQLHELSSQSILLADGKGALVKAKPPQTTELGIKAHFTDILSPGDAIELFGVDGHYGGVAPIEDGQWNVAFSIPQWRLEADLDRMFARIIQENPILRERFASAARCSPWLASPLPRFGVANRWNANVIPLGNAAAAIEPVGGEGMGLAMRSAELAARMVMSDRADLDQLRRSFQRLWRARSVSCRAVARMVSNPRISKWVHPSIARFTPLTHAVMSLMGK